MIAPLVITALIYAAPTPAPDQREAERLFRAGDRAYQAGQYLPAIRALEEAYRLTPFPEIAFSLAQANRLQFFVDGELRWLSRAVDLYRIYVSATDSGARRADAVSLLAEIGPLYERRAGERQKPPPVAPPPETQLMITSPVEGALASVDGGPAEVLPKVKTVAAGNHQVVFTAEGYESVSEKALALEGRVVPVEAEPPPKPGRLDLSAFEAGAELRVDGLPAGVTPLERPLPLAPGGHRLVLAKNGHLPRLVQLTVERDQTHPIAGELSISTQRQIAYYSLGASAVALAGTGAMFALTLVAEGKALDLLASRDATGLDMREADEYEALRDRRDGRAVATWICAGTTVFMFALGTLLYAFDAPDLSSF